MLGAIAGDVIGSFHEWEPTKRKDFPLLGDRSIFTDDSVLTCAVADTMLAGSSYRDRFHDWWAWYPGAGYGESFHAWAERRDPLPYGSWGNGSAMRVSPVSWAFSSLEAVRAEATRSAEATHNHPEGVKGACAVAEAIFLARTGHSRQDIQRHTETRFGYRMPPIASYHRRYRFDVSAAGSVPQAIRSFLESTSFEDAVRTAVALGGDADTQAAIAGSIAEAFYGGVPRDIAVAVLARLDDRMRATVREFRARHGVPSPA